MNFNQWTIESLAKSFRNNQLNIVTVAQEYVKRISQLDSPDFNSIIRLNPLWEEQAAKLQLTLPSSDSPLHGIPILIKDNIDTWELGNSAGSIALKDMPVDENAAIIQQLIQAGALILGKTNLSEWANFRSTQSISGWSSLGGQTHNAFSKKHSPSGSSSGSAVAVSKNFCVAAIGTETDGSIVSPAAHNGIVGLKPTLGRVSRTGIIPIAWSQDTAGPMTRNVKDAALLLDALCSGDVDDPITQTQPNPPSSFAEHCVPDYLSAKRIGILQENDTSEFSSQTFKAISELLNSHGAQCISIDSIPLLNTLQEHELIQMTSEFPEALENYFKTRRTQSPYLNLQDIVDFNKTHTETAMPFFAQELFDECLLTSGTQSSIYKNAQRQIEQFKIALQTVVFDEHNLDALLCESNGAMWLIDHENGDKYTGGNSSLAAISGWPSITIPLDHKEGFALGGLLISPPWQESKLLGIAWSLEQALKNK